MKKLLFLAAAILMLQATPVLAAGHEGGEGHKGKMFEKHDTDGDGKISEAEFLAKAKAKFAEKDTNGDGFITQDEAKAARGEMKEKMKEKRGEMREKMKERMENKASEAAE